MLPRYENSKAMQRIVAVLKDHGDMSARQLAERAFVSYSCLVSGGYLRALKSHGLLHICGWIKGNFGFKEAIIRFGPGEDAERQKLADNESNSIGLIRIESALKEHGPLSYREAALLSGLSLNTIKNCKYMDILVSQGRAHICSWRRNRSGANTALYAHGDGDNMPKLKPLSEKEIRSRYRIRKIVFDSNKSITSIMTKTMRS